MQLCCCVTATSDAESPQLHDATLPHKKMTTTSHTACLSELIAASKKEELALRSYKKINLEGGSGYNPHETALEKMDKEIASLTVLDLAERAANLDFDQTAAIRAWVNSNKFGSASAADNALRDKKDITLDGLKSAMSRHGIA